MKMTKLLIAAASILCLTQNIFANSCLESASDYELLSEIQKRMDSSDTGTGKSSVYPTVECERSHYLKISLYDSKSGKKETFKKFIGNQEHCKELDHTIGSRINSKTLKEDKILFACVNNFYLTRFIITTDLEIKEVDNTFQPDSTECFEKAILYNSNL